MATTRTADVIVLGGGLIGSAIALELESRGATVVLLDRGICCKQTSFAAAGMLAADDPHNPAALHALARRSVSLYPGFLESLTRRCGIPVPLQTTETFQYTPGKAPELLQEASLDPRRLATAVRHALHLACNAQRLCVQENTVVATLKEQTGAVNVQCEGGLTFSAACIVHATGPWQLEEAGANFRVVVVPKKGQMVRVSLPGMNALNSVHRSPDVYVVPRRAGEQAGSAIIGATVEDVGYDRTVDAAAIGRLVSLAAGLTTELQWILQAKQLETWAGLRPATKDGLPLIGSLMPKSDSRKTPSRYVAMGHFRNGILLGPATAEAVADLIERRQPTVSLSAFDPARFGDPRG